MHRPVSNCPHYLPSGHSWDNPRDDILVNVRSSPKECTSGLGYYVSLWAMTRPESRLTDGLHKSGNHLLYKKVQFNTDSSALYLKTNQGTCFFFFPFLSLFLKITCDRSPIVLYYSLGFKAGAVGGEK